MADGAEDLSCGCRPAELPARDHAGISAPIAAVDFTSQAWPPIAGGPEALR
jgi:hypothetical protein